MGIGRSRIALVLLLCPLFAFAQQSDEEAVWKIERSYWEDVKTLDLDAYRALWHPNFVGWPIISAKPVRNENITGWITANTDKGLHLESYTIKPAASQATDNLVVVHYWVTLTWAEKDQKRELNTLRIMHTWIRVGKGWQIISGMSAPEPEAKK